jgi:predicted nucleic acid-binding protein
MKRKVYIETSVVSYLTARKSGNPIVSGHQESTRELWNRLNELDVFISDLVLQEASCGDEEQARARLDALASFRALEVDDEAKALAKTILAQRAVPDEYPEDALHVALATVNGLDFIVTWNFSHINNPFTRMMIRQVVENAGYVAPEICSPDELLGDEI